MPYQVKIIFPQKKLCFYHYTILFIMMLTQYKHILYTLRVFNNKLVKRK